MEKKQVSVEPPPPALNMTLTAFAAERRARSTTPAARRPQLSIDISCTQQQTCQTPLLLSIDGTDGWKDRRTDTRPSHRPCSAYCAAASRHAVDTQLVRSADSVSFTVMYVSLLFIYVCFSCVYKFCMQRLTLGQLNETD